MRVCSLPVKHWTFHELVEPDHTFGIEISASMSFGKKIRSRRGGGAQAEAEAQPDGGLPRLQTPEFKDTSRIINFSAHIWLHYCCIGTEGLGHRVGQRFQRFPSCSLCDPAGGNSKALSVRNNVSVQCRGFHQLLDQLQICLSLW